MIEINLKGIKFVVKYGIIGCFLLKDFWFVIGFVKWFWCFIVIKLLERGKCKVKVNIVEFCIF